MQGRESLQRAQAIAEAEHFCPDATVLDIALPDMDGYEGATRLQDLPCLDQSVLVAVTGYARWQDRRQCGEAGFDLFFPKPVDFTVLEHILWLIAESRRLRESSRQRTYEQKAAFAAFLASTP